MRFAHFKTALVRGAGSTIAALLLLCGLLLPAAEYLDNPALEKRLKDLEGNYPQRVRVRSLAQTLQTNQVWLAEVGTGDSDSRQRRPALLLVAGIDGWDLAGTATALFWLEDILKRSGEEEKLRGLLDTTTVYVFPRVNPDGARHFFTRPQREQAVNDRPVDEDHDGLIDEDEADDLDGNGLITSMRVEDPDGEYILHPSEPRLLIKADRLKGEKGAWRLLIEGRDDDRDERWNEDGRGGVNPNRNFPYGYKFFEPGSGKHQVSEPESRALADFVVAHPNIGIAFTFGAADNLLQPPKSEAPKRPPVTIQPDDAPYYRELGKEYREALGLKKELSSKSEPGTFSDWMYYHRGRLSLAAQPWTLAIQTELAKGDGRKKEQEGKEEQPGKPAEESKTEEPSPKSSEADKDKSGKDDEKKDDKRAEDERASLAWVDEHAPEAFIPWQPFDHPDFPGQKVEIGGYAPFARNNPPKELIEEVAEKHARFLTGLLEKFPKVALRKAEVKHLGNEIYDVTLQVENAGYLPSALAQGETTREVHPTRVILKIDEEAILSGRRVTTLAALAGSGGMKEVRWIVRAKGKETIEVEIVSMLGGTVQETLKLKEEK